MIDIVHVHVSERHEHALCALCSMHSLRSHALWPHSLGIWTYVVTGGHKHTADAKFCQSCGAQI